MDMDNTLRATTYLDDVRARLFEGEEARHGVRLGRVASGQVRDERRLPGLLALGERLREVSLCGH